MMMKFIWAFFVLGFLLQSNPAMCQNTGIQQKMEIMAEQAIKDLQNDLKLMGMTAESANRHVYKKHLVEQVFCSDKAPVALFADFRGDGQNVTAQQFADTLDKLHPKGFSVHFSEKPVLAVHKGHKHKKGEVFFDCHVFCFFERAGKTKKQLVFMDSLCISLYYNAREKSKNKACIKAIATMPGKKASMPTRQTIQQAYGEMFSYVKKRKYKQFSVNNFGLSNSMDDFFSSNAQVIVKCYDSLPADTMPVYKYLARPIDTKKDTIVVENFDVSFIYDLKPAPNGNVRAKTLRLENIEPGDDNVLFYHKKDTSTTTLSPQAAQKMEQMLYFDRLIICHDKNKFE